LPDLRKRTDGRLVNKRALASLIKSGAFESTGFARNALLQELITDGKVPRQSAFPQPLDERELLRDEYQALGVYLTDHPLRRLLPFIQAMDCLGTREIAQSRPGKSVRFFGTVADPHDRKTKMGQDMCSMTLADHDGTIDAAACRHQQRDSGP
jgi:DNA polymerase-3 subunit alpha